VIARNLQEIEFLPQKTNYKIDSLKQELNQRITDLSTRQESQYKELETYV